MIRVPTTSHGVAKLATPEETEREKSRYFLGTDTGLLIVTDSGIPIVMNIPDMGYTNPNLHRRLDLDPVYVPGVHYPFVKYNDDGVPFKQTAKFGTWDGINSYRTTTTYTHDEESTTCEIP